jgi:hypothetical protein
MNVEEFQAALNELVQVQVDEETKSIYKVIGLCSYPNHRAVSIYLSVNAEQEKFMLTDAGGTYEAYLAHNKNTPPTKEAYENFCAHINTVGMRVIKEGDTHCIVTPPLSLTAFSIASVTLLSSFCRDGFYSLAGITFPTFK